MTTSIKEFINSTIDNIDQIPDVIDTQLDVKFIRKFIGERAVIYRGFVENFAGAKGKSGQLLYRIDEFDYQTWVEQSTDEERRVSNINHFYNWNEVYVCIKTLWGMCCNPTGEQVVNYITMCLRCLFIAKTYMTDKVIFSTTLNNIVKTLTDGTINSVNNLFKDFNGPQKSLQYFNKSKFITFHTI